MKKPKWENEKFLPETASEFYMNKDLFVNSNFESKIGSKERKNQLKRSW